MREGQKKRSGRGAEEMGWEGESSGRGEVAEQGGSTPFGSIPCTITSNALCITGTWTGAPPRAGSRQQPRRRVVLRRLPATKVVR